MKNPLRSQAGSEPKSFKQRQSRTADLWVGSVLYATPPGRRRGRGTVSAMPHATSPAVLSAAISPSPFRALFVRHAAFDRAQGAPS
jgi:hypothetical protein